MATASKTVEGKRRDSSTVKVNVSEATDNVRINIEDISGLVMVDVAVGHSLRDVSLAVTVDTAKQIHAELGRKLGLGGRA